MFIYSHLHTERYTTCGSEKVVTKIATQRQSVSVSQWRFNNSGRKVNCTSYEFKSSPTCREISNQFKQWPESLPTAYVHYLNILDTVHYVHNFILP
jgi:hypothetical protein